MRQRWQHAVTTPPVGHTMAFMQAAGPLDETSSWLLYALFVRTLDQSRRLAYWAGKRPKRTGLTCATYAGVLVTNNDSLRMGRLLSVRSGEQLRTSTANHDAESGRTMSSVECSSRPYCMRGKVVLMMIIAFSMLPEHQPIPEAFVYTCRGLTFGTRQAANSALLLAGNPLASCQSGDSGAMRSLPARMRWHPGSRHETWNLLSGFLGVTDALKHPRRHPTPRTPHAVGLGRTCGRTPSSRCSATRWGAHLHSGIPRPELSLGLPAGELSLQPHEPVVVCFGVGPCLLLPRKPRRAVASSTPAPTVWSI